MKSIHDDTYMTLSHSPAPWSYDGPPHNIHVRQANDPNMRICFMTSDGPTEANARLIAAAPIMLVALECAAHALDALHPDGGRLVHPTPKEMIERTLAIIKEALANATGATR